MPELLLWIVGGLIVAIGILLVYAATRPSDFRVSRSIRIASSREKIFPLIEDLKSFFLWNPFAKQDPALTIAYSGPASGKGAAYAWNSRGRAGKGSLEIIDMAPPSSVTMALHIEKPMEGHNTVLFTLQANGEATDVTWAMTGRYAYVAKVMGVICNMDRMIGGEFEKGLASLKTLAERP